MPLLPAFALLGALLVATAAPLEFEAASGPSDAGVVDEITDLRGAATPGAATRRQAPPLPPPCTTPTADTASFLDPTPTPAPDPDAVVDPRLEAMTAAAAAALEACWNAGD